MIWVKQEDKQGKSEIIYAAPNHLQNYMLIYNEKILLEK
jgi:hypothetical protein